MHTDGPAEKPRDAGTFELREAGYLLRNNFWKIFLCVIAATGAAFLYLRHTGPTYASTAVLEVAPVNRQDPNAMEDLEASETLKTIQLKIASDNVLLGVIRQQHLADDPRFAPRDGAPASAGLRGRAEAALNASLRTAHAGGLADRLFGPLPAHGPYSDAELIQRLAAKVDVSLVRGSRLIQIQVEDRTPEGAQRLAKAIIDEFFRQSWDAKHRESAAARELLLAEAKRVGEDFRTSQEKLEAYRDKYHAVSLAERQNIVVERMRDLNQQAAAAKNQRLSLEAEQAQAARLASTDPEALLVVGAIADLPEIIDLRKQIALQEALSATLAKRYGPLHPTMIQARTQLEELHRSLQGAIRKAAQRIQETYASAQGREQSIDAALAEQEKAALELDRIAIPYHSLEHDVQANGTMYQKVLDSLKETDVTHGLMLASDVDGTSIRVLQSPLLPARPARPRQKLLLAFSVVAGLFLGCGSALLSRALDNTVTSIDDAESLLGLPVLAAVPRSRHRRLSGRPIVLTYPQSLQAEAFRSLRTSLSLLPDGPEHNCMLFTSAVPGEGKSFCALNLAAALAQQGYRTLLIDADLRRPSLHWLADGTGGKPRLTDCLKNPELFPTAVQATAIPHLSCLGDWKYTSGGAELLGRGSMRRILEQARASFDQVVIDTAPLMAVSDTLHIARDVPTICLVVQAGKTPRRLVRRSLKLLNERAQRAVSGVILNKISLQPSAGHYYYYYNYSSTAKAKA